ncbi:nicotinate-nucleotide adenylyltransferase [Paenibacillus marinisediminis]
MTVPMKRIGVLGGTFDPIHVGHLVAAESAKEAMHLDQVWFMPTHVPPHKEKKSAVTAEQRVEMVRLAILENESFHLCTWEMEHGGVSYTLETVKWLQSEYPEIEWFWIIGGDMVHYLPNWNGIDELMERIRFIGVQRPGSTWKIHELPGAWRSRVVPAPMPLIDISSTDVRERIEQGLSIRYLVPDAVLQYSQRWGLYES